jgi:intracellular septation protein A
MGPGGRRWAWATVRHAGPCLIEGTAVPLVVFTVVVHAVGLTPALWASLLWSGTALGRRVVRGRRVSGVLLIAAVGTCFRLATVLWTASPFLFFLQPVVATVATALAFGVSVVLGRPLAARLGADLVPIDEEAWVQPDVRRACARLSVVWCAGLLANAGLTLWLLWHLPVATFVLVRPLVGVVTTLPAIAVSCWVGARVVGRSNGRIRLAGGSEVAPSGRASLVPVAAVAPVAPVAAVAAVPALALAS